MSVDNGQKTAIDFDAEFRIISRKRKTKVYQYYQYQDLYESTDEEYSDTDSELESDSESDDGFYEMPNTDDLIDFLIDNSKLDPIITIRRHEHETALLKRELKDLVEQKTLDRGQLKSFIESLVEPVHLTQGPPGTGKSYLGVVIVQALIKIRNAWMSVCQSVGEPPILVLSYKNHAIDEFLVDLVKSERNVSLIRIGGSCNDPNLNMYLEQNQSSYKYKTEKSRNLLRKLHDQKMEHQEMKSKLSPISGWDALRGFDPVDMEQADALKQAAFQATVYLCSLIVRIREIESYLVRDEECFNSDSLNNTEEEEFTDFWERLFLESDQDIIKTITQADIETLWSRVTHYNLTVPEIFFRWMSGFTPLAKCFLAECPQIVSSREYKYCEDHLCAYGSDKTVSRCTYPRIPDHLLCNQHACQAESCRAVKLSSQQIYCEEHACFICVREGCVAKLGEDEPPRNTCGDHKLCTALIGEGFTCTELSLNNTQFCKEHAKPVCSHVLPDGRHCPQYAASRGISYCDDHKPKPKPVTESKDFTARTCKALTLRKKRPCQSKPMDGFEYCRDHAEKYKATPVKIQKKNENACDMVTDEISTLEPVEQVVNFHQTKVLPSKEKLQEENDFLKKQEEVLVLEKKDEIKEVDSENAGESEIAEYEEPLPDEVDVKPDDEEDYYFEEDDQLQHCRDVHVIEDREVEEKSDEEDSSTAAPDEFGDSVAQDNAEVPVSMWTWEMSLEERWTQAKLQEQKYKSLLAKLSDKRNTEIEIAREEYHKAKVRAKSQVYEQKEVIGGTIVGCIGRLESIRKTKPFAVLVEEASEVLEPLLFACLGEATMKFEMIGDHLQLKPSIMSKIMFERVNR